MPRRKWDAKTKALIGLEGLKGKPVTEICAEHQSSPSQYYQWRDQLLAHAGKAFEVHQPTRTEARLAQENARLKKLVGELTWELKKATSCWDEAAPAAPGHAPRCHPAPPDPGTQGGASLLGLPAHLGLSACRGAASG